MVDIKVLAFLGHEIVKLNAMLEGEDKTGREVFEGIGVFVNRLASRECRDCNRRRQSVRLFRG